MKWRIVEDANWRRQDLTHISIKLYEAHIFPFSSSNGIQQRPNHNISTVICVTDKCGDDCVKVFCAKWNKTVSSTKINMESTFKNMQNPPFLFCTSDLISVSSLKQEDIDLIPSIEMLNALLTVDNYPHIPHLIGFRKSHRNTFDFHRTGVNDIRRLRRAFP